MFVVWGEVPQQWCICLIKVWEGDLEEDLLIKEQVTPPQSQFAKQFCVCVPRASHNPVCAHPAPAAWTGDNDRAQLGQGDRQSRGTSRHYQTLLRWQTRALDLATWFCFLARSPGLGRAIHGPMPV